jgi:hypothetical protein
MAKEGKLGESISLYRDSALPIYESIGDVISAARVRCLIAFLLLELKDTSSTEEAARLLVAAYPVFSATDKAGALYLAKVAAAHGLALEENVSIQNDGKS